MHKNSTRFVLLTASLSAFLLAGCISSSKTEYVDETRVSVSFESDKAQKTFFEGMSKNKQALASAGKPSERSTVALVLVNVSHHTITSGPNRDFNVAVGLCDTDKNGIITEAEAEQFSANGAKQQSPGSTVIKN